jgi:predicted amidohydrolase
LANGSKIVRVAVVLPHSYFGEEEWKNASAALSYVDEAARERVDLICFPEGYPGPASGPLHPKQLSAKPIGLLCQKAVEHHAYIGASDIEENPQNPQTYFLTLKVISPEGRISRYVRVQPDTPPLNAALYSGKAHLLPGEDFGIVQTKFGTVGLEICSELYVPEISRILMLRGAEILYAPVNGSHSISHEGGTIRDTWRCVARARAAENLCYVIVTENLYQIEGQELTSRASGAFVAGPEELIGVREKEGILVAELDMERLDFLRNRNADEMNLSKPDATNFKPTGCRPGQIWERRPELYKELCETHKYSFNYLYYRDNLDAWIEEYDRKIYGGKYKEIQKRYGKLTFNK